MAIGGTGGGRTVRGFGKPKPGAKTLALALKSAPPIDASAATADPAQMTPMDQMPAADANRSLPNPYAGVSAAIEKNIKPLGDPSLLSAFVRGAQSYIDTRAARRQQEIQEARDKWQQQVNDLLMKHALAQNAREEQGWGAQDAAAAQQQQALGQFTQGMSGRAAAAAMLDRGAAVKQYLEGQVPRNFGPGSQAVTFRPDGQPVVHYTNTNFAPSRARPASTPAPPPGFNLEE